jgi:hypothetical protein
MNAIAKESLNQIFPKKRLNHLNYFQLSKYQILKDYLKIEADAL